MDSLQAYEDRAVALASEAGRLSTLRDRLAEAREGAALFDSQRWTRAWERALRSVWRRYEAGEAPADIAA